MKLTVRDALSTVLFAAIAVPNIGYLVNGETAPAVAGGPGDPPSGEHVQHAAEQPVRPPERGVEAPHAAVTPAVGWPDRSGRRQ